MNFLSSCYLSFSSIYIRILHFSSRGSDFDEGVEGSGNKSIWIENDTRHWLANTEDDTLWRHIVPRDLKRAYIMNLNIINENKVSKTYHTLHLYDACVETNYNIPTFRIPGGIPIPYIETARWHAVPL